MLGRHSVVAIPGCDQQPIMPELVREQHPVPVVPARVPFGGVFPGDDENLAGGPELGPERLDNVDHEPHAASGRSPVWTLPGNLREPSQPLVEPGPLDSLVRHGFGEHENNLVESEAPLRDVGNRHVSDGRRIECSRQQADTARSEQPARDRPYHYSRYGPIAPSRLASSHRSTETGRCSDQTSR